MSNEPIEQSPAYWFGRISTQIENLTDAVKGVEAQFKDVHADIDKLEGRVERIELASAAEDGARRRDARWLKIASAIGGSSAVTTVAGVLWQALHR